MRKRTLIFLALLLTFLTPGYLQWDALSFASDYTSEYSYTLFHPLNLAFSEGLEIALLSIPFLPVIYLSLFFSISNLVQLIGKFLLFFLLLRAFNITQVRTKRTLLILAAIIIMSQFAGIIIIRSYLGDNFLPKTDDFLTGLQKNMSREEVMALKESTIPQFITEDSTTYVRDGKNHSLELLGNFDNSFGIQPIFDYCIRLLPNEDSYYSYIQLCFSQQDMLTYKLDHL